MNNDRWVRVELVGKTGPISRQVFPISRPEKVASCAFEYTFLMAKNPDLSVRITSHDSKDDAFLGDLG